MSIKQDLIAVGIPIDKWTWSKEFKQRLRKLKREARAAERNFRRRREPEGVQEFVGALGPETRKALLWLAEWRLPDADCLQAALSECGQTQERPGQAKFEKQYQELVALLNAALAEKG